jgi:putrescine aminotransferase
MTTTSTTAAQFARHVDPAFVKLLGVLGYGRVLTRAEGVYIWDEQGRRYLDLLAGFGSVNIGHNHPRLLARLRSFFDDRALNLSHTGPSPYAARLAEALARAAGEPLDMALFSTSGAEAVEAAIKAARAATRRSKIVFCDRGYHGLSLGTLSTSTSKRMRHPFEPLLPGCVPVPFGDPDALSRALARNDVAAFLVEPVQIEGGVRFAPPGYLQEARRLCTKHGTLLALDEVQTGFGRTGSLFAFEQENARPDLLILAKAAGGSIAPLGVTMTTRRVQKLAYGSMRRFDLHGSTFAGNAFACAAALETLGIIQDEDLVGRSRDRGVAMLAALRQRLAGHPLVADIRGRGLLAAIELRSIASMPNRIAGQWLALALLERGAIVQPASQAWNVLRIEPPLTIEPAQIADAVDAIGAVFDDHASIVPVLAKSGRRIVDQLLARGRFR